MGPTRVLRHYPNVCPPPDWPNLVLAAVATDASYSERGGPLSIKCVFRGEEMHEVGRAQFLVDSASYLILNEGQRYSSYCCPQSPTETFTIFFAPGFAEEALRSLISPSERLLDTWAATPGQAVHFVERLYGHDTVVTPKILEIRKAILSGTVDESWLDEQFYTLVERLLVVHRGVMAEVDKLPAARASTRLEIYRRLWRARDFITANQSCRLSLNRMAEVACLSPHHFLRAFKEVFGETPHRFLIRRRLERARALLLTTDRSITEICFELGFQSVGSFSARFRQETGLSPSTFRRGSR